jgi:LCP family protein required for cell wall assembly
MSSVNRRPVGRASVPGRSASSRESTRGPRTPTAYGTSRSGTSRYGNAPKRRTGPKPRWGRIALVVFVAFALCGGITSVLWYAGVESDLERTDPFSALTKGRPPETVKGVQNILLVGTDQADPDSPADDPGQARTDTIILMHIPSTQDHAYLVSMPRDLWVSVPHKATDAECGSRRAKINAAYAWGDLPLLVKTVECFSGVRINHVVQIDFGGFKQVVDALGGVDMPIERDITSIHPPYRTFHKGVMHLDGAQALDYSRQRKQFPDGDFARMRHQQQLLKIMLDRAVSTETLTNPVKFDNFVKAVTKAVKVDEDFKLLDTALQFRGLRSKDLTFLTSPYSGTDDIDGQSVVLSDKPKAIALYNAIASDKMAEWASAYISPSPVPN